MRAALLDLKGVLAAEVNLKSGLARVTYDPTKLKPERLPEALNGTPYSASLVSSEKK